MTTINQEEIQKFSKLADEWWDAKGKFKPLHTFNPIRLKYIIEKCTSHFKVKRDQKEPLSKLKILDIGCGGGLISEPLSRLGAKVTGIDASIKNIKVAKIHAKKSDLKIRYIATSPEQKLIKEKFDVVLSLEVVEHVKNLDLFFKSSSSLLRENGIMFVATLNRTFESYLKPDEIEEKLKKLNLKKMYLDGLKFNILNSSWNLSNDCSVNYIMVAKKD
jgi:2-polyprenyl-6-hydroxyphenyl methylase/3-demethylubiquinone-9 3-methyltransferase